MKSKTKLVKMTVAAAVEAAKAAQQEKLSVQQEILEEAREKHADLEALLDELDAIEVPSELISMEVEVPAVDKVDWHRLEAEAYLRPIIQAVEQQQGASGDNSEALAADDLSRKLAEVLFAQLGLMVVFN